MSFYRQRWRIDLDGFDEPVDVTTSARDSIDIVVPTVGGEPQFAMGIVLKIVHNALVRTSVPGIPRHYTDFLDIVEDANEVSDAPAGEGAAGLDPTRAALSGG